MPKHHLVSALALWDCGAMADGGVIISLRRRVEELMERHHIGAKPLARKAGLGETVVRDLIKGHKKDVQLSTLEALAAALEVPLSSLLPIQESFTQLGPSLPVKGAVAAGVWKEAMEWPQDDWTTFTGRSDVTADLEHRFGLLVEGESMADLYPPGTVIECVSVFGRAEIEAGKRVVVIRRRDTGDVEATVKEYVIDANGRQWLRPRSSNPAFQEWISLETAEPGILETRIVAIVVGSFRPE